MTAPKTKTEVKPVATKLDLSKMSYAELQELAKEASELVDMKKSEEIKVLADGFVKKATAAGFSKADIKAAVDAMLPGGKSKSAPKKATGPKPTPGATYKDPATGETWTKAANGKGKTKGWLQAYIVSGKKFEDYLVK